MVLAIGEYYKVKVISFRPSGVIVEFEDKDTGFIHLSQISTEFVHSSDEYVSLDDELMAMGVPGKAHPVELSIKHLNLPSKLAKKPRPTRPKAYNKPDVRLNDFSKPAVYVPPKRSFDSLDDMIDNFNKQYADKTKDQRRKASGEFRRRRQSK